MPLDRTAFNALVDDTGAANGTVWNKAQISAVALDPVDAALAPLVARVIQTITLVGVQNDLALTSGCSMLRCNNATLLTITGLATGTPGQLIALHAVGAGHIALTPQLTGTASAAANRLINTVTKGNTMLAAGAGVAIYQYDGTLTRWKLVSHEQGAAIDVAYNAGDYTASTGTWTVTAGNLVQYAYYQQGKRALLQIYVASSTVSATPNTLRAALPNGWTIGNKLLSGTLFYINATGSWTAGGSFDMGLNNTYMALWALFTGTWATSTSTTQLQGFVTVDLQ